MPLNFNIEGESVILDREGFRERFAKTEEEKREMRVQKAEQKVREDIMEKTKTVVPPVASKGEKDSEKRRITEAIKKALTDAGIPVSSEKAGEVFVRMPSTDWQVKVTFKKERVAALDAVEKGD